ncbi:hypothetical protein [Alteromonas sp. CYL-A6]|uniref:hypothetical protein n=1 Tax=Alteromonas nitratireducens TaxID=3390813 RepID=UPI0034A71B33
MKKYLAPVMLITMSFCTFTSASAENKQHTKRENAEYVAVAHYQVEPGNREEAKKLIKDYFMPATKKAENPLPTVYFMMTGDQSVMLVYPLTLGPGELAYTETWEDKKFIQALSELAGGDKEAQAKLKRFGELFRLKAMNLGYTDTSL